MNLYKFNNENYIKVSDMVEFLNKEINEYDNPNVYCGSDYYIKWAKVDILEDILWEVRDAKEE